MAQNYLNVFSYSDTFSNSLKQLKCEYVGVLIILFQVKPRLKTLKIQWFFQLPSYFELDQKSENNFEIPINIFSINFERFSFVY